MAIIDDSADPHSLIREPLLSLMFENAAVGIAQVDHTGQLIMVNNKLSEITGYSREELLQKTFQEFTHPDDLEADLKQAEALYRGDIHSYKLEKRYIRKDGSIVWVKLNSSAIFDDNGNFYAFIGIIEDISEKKKTENALKEKQEKITNILNNITDCYIALDRDWRLCEINKEAERKIFQQPVATLKGKVIWDLYPKGRNDIFHREYERAFYENVPVHFEAHSNVTDKWLEVHAYPQGNYLEIFFRDITKRKNLENELRESEEKIRILANNMSQLAWMMDNNGWVFWYNQRWYDYTGTTLEEMKGWGWQKIHHPQHVDRVVQTKKQAIESGEVWEELFPIKGKDGKYRWFLTRAIPLENKNGTVIRWLGTNTDVTHQREIENRLKSDNKLFEDLLYISAHDLKGPVANMYGALDLMDRLPPEKKVMFLNRFRDLADQLNKTIGGITDILRMRNNNQSAASTINVDNLLDKVLAELDYPTHKASIHRHFEKITIRYIEVFLYSIVKNLLSNSFKYCRENVPLCIEIKSQVENDYTLLSISDNGLGIDMKKYGAKLFSPFQRVNSVKTKGTGIGLYLIKDIIQKNGGYISVESSPGNGTTFNCYLKEYNS